MRCTIFKNLFDKEPHYINVNDALARIKSGKSKTLIEEIRKQIDKERADGLKRNLPSVCFSGEFTERKDEFLKKHSGFIVLDFDEVQDLRDKQTEIISNAFVYACWLSPRGNGLKALVKIADGSKHREHFQALQDIFKEVDRSGINQSRVCFESYDPEIYINEKAKVFTKIKITEKYEQKERLDGSQEIFDNILKWLSNKGNAFETGERNIFIFKLASACCRFGISENETISLIAVTFINGSNSFTIGEAEKAVRSAYRSNKSKAGTAIFEKSILVDRTTKSEVEFEQEIIDLNEKAKDVIFGEDVKQGALKIYDSGYESVDPLGIDLLDEYFKDKRGEVTLLTGIGNYGKSSFWKYRLLIRVIKFKNKFAIFSPEDNPAEEFYHDCVEIMLGCDCTPKNPNRPSKMIYERCYDFISKHIFYVYPKEIEPTPKYIKERFLELIVKEKIDGCIIDPFNQLTNDYGNGRTDKYLETILSDFLRFAQANNVFFSIIAHPTKLKKEADGNYPCPEVFDIADGAMWNNKMDNILVYHRPNHLKDPQSAVCEFHSKKIRRQKTVGKKGMALFEMVRPKRRFFFDGMDYMQKFINETGLNFQYNYSPTNKDDGTIPLSEFEGF